MNDKTLEMYRQFGTTILEKFQLGSFKRRLIARENFDMEKLLATSNAKYWTEQFIKLNKGLVIDDTFESTMVGWFANIAEVARRQGETGIAK